MSYGSLAGLHRKDANPAALQVTLAVEFLADLDPTTTGVNPAQTCHLISRSPLCAGYGDR
jgi:hypothetical protein